MFKKIFASLFMLTFAFAEQTEPTNQPHSVVILGGGISGLSSGIYLARSGLKPIIIEGQTSSLITQAHAVENWPAEKIISGSQLIEKLKEQAIASGCTILSKEALKVDFSRRPFAIEVKDLLISENKLDNKNETLLANNCLIAMGCQSKHLNVEGEKEYWSKGVSACALCDGTLYKDKTVAVVGGSKAAVLESAYLSNLAKKVYVIVRANDFRKTVEPRRKEILLAKENVEVIYNAKIEKILGNGEQLEKVLLSNGKELLIDGLFTAIGLKPNTDLFAASKSLSTSNGPVLDLNERGFIQVKEGQKTSIEGVYAAGDIIEGQDKQAILAAASGVKAALAIEQTSFLDEKKVLIKNVAVETAKTDTEPKVFKPIPQKEVSFEIKPLSGVKPSAELNKSLKTETADKKVAEKAALEQLSVDHVSADNTKPDHKNDSKVAEVKVIEIKNKDQLEKELKDSTTPVIVDFYATRCGPCQKIGPLLEKLPASKVKLLKVNVDMCGGLAREYKIMAMPTAILFNAEGNILSTKIGFYEIQSLIKEFSVEGN